MPNHTRIILYSFFFLLPFYVFTTTALSWSDGGDAVPPRESVTKYANTTSQENLSVPGVSNHKVEMSPNAGDWSILSFMISSIFYAKRETNNS